MNSAKKKRLETNGWKVGTTADFLNLSPEEVAFIDLKLSLSKALQELRKSKKHPFASRRFFFALFISQLSIFLPQTSEDY